MTLRRGWVLTGVLAVALTGPIPARAAAFSADASVRAHPPLLLDAASPSDRDGDPRPSFLRRTPVARELAISAALLGAGFALDRSVRPNFPEHGSPLLYAEEPGEIFGGGAFLVSATGGLAAGGLALRRPALLRTGARLGLAVGITSVTIGVLKLATQRERPDGSNRYSFPSGHTGAAFAAATVIDREVGGVAGWLAYGAAAMAGEARIADNHHYLSDVIAGALVGRAIGRLLTRRSVPAAEAEPWGGSGP